MATTVHGSGDFSIKCVSHNGDIEIFKSRTKKSRDIDYSFAVKHRNFKSVEKQG